MFSLMVSLLFSRHAYIDLHDDHHALLRHRNAVHQIRTQVKPESNHLSPPANTKVASKTISKTVPTNLTALFLFSNNQVSLGRHGWPTNDSFYRC